MSLQGDLERGLSIAAKQREAFKKLALTNGAAFNTYVLKDEETGNPINNADFHIDWHYKLDEPTTNKLVLWSHIESAKSNSITVGHTLRCLGKNPRLRVAICSNTTRQASKFLGTIKRYIEGSNELHELYPKLRPSEANWAAESITVVRPGALKDPSVAALGIGVGILGARIDLLILDDFLDHVNVRNKAQREAAIAWFMSTLMGRVTRNGRIICLGTAWSPEDLYHVLAAKAGWVALRYPVRYPDGKLNWPERWSAQRIKEIMGTMSPIEVGRQLFCQASGDDEGGFEQDWIDKSLANGRGVGLVKYLSMEDRASIAAQGGIVVVGCDPASGKHKRKRAGASTVFTVLLVWPNGTNQILWVEGGAYSAPDIRDKLIDLYYKFGAPVFVEDNAVQGWMIELVQEVSDVPIFAFTTGANKRDPVFGVESVGNAMQQGKVILPSKWDDSAGKLMPIGQVGDLVTDMQSYSPNTHTGDYQMSYWVAREGARSIVMVDSAAGAAIA